MRIVIAGGSGLIGRELTYVFINHGYHVSILSRQPQKVKGMPSEVSLLQWDGKSVGEWVQDLGNSDVVINLTGENLSGDGLIPSRWTTERMRRLVQSRIDSGKVLVEAITSLQKRPKVFVQASGINYYGTNRTGVVDEDSGVGDDFLANLSKEWEASTALLESYGVRRVVIRSGIVLSVKGGALPRLLLPYRLFIGGDFGSGRQIYSWIHIQDEVKAIKFLIANEQASGVYNLTAPNPVTNHEFGKTIARVMKRPHYFPIPGFLLTIVLGKVASLVLEGVRVMPKRLLALGYQFSFPTLEEALRDIILSHG